MAKVGVFSACKSYKKTLENFGLLIDEFNRCIVEKEFGECSKSTTKIKTFIILGETVEISISPISAEFIIGKVEFNLIVDPLSKPIQKHELMTLYVDSSGRCDLNLPESGRLLGSFGLDEPSDVEEYVTKVVLKSFLTHFGVETY
ncbi:hypothetical protein KFE26_13840 [Shewanella sp. M16]|uniref:hypothetical protein n=1 Tax=Shewanella TaxID=22 RepID=UPI001BB0885F|nr:hypothetical protein [Shewanella sp. M16]MBS0043373.1 hypothetical protein [Shewanella sp. M16]QYW06206.1 hypothetical protein MuM161_p17 [Shewanella phage vB_SspS_MuM16-1]